MCLSVSPNPLAPGGSAQITYGPVSTAGPSVTVTIDDGGNQADTVDITLDDEGSGTGWWQVPISGWTVAVFNAPGCPSVTVYVTAESE